MTLCSYGICFKRQRVIFRKGKGGIVMGYQVIEIINKTTLLVSYGLVDGAKKGDKLRIYEKGEPVLDLNKQLLGTLDAVKSTITVVIPYEKFSLCQNAETVELELLGPLTQIARETKKIKNFNVNQAELSHRKLPKPAPIKIGDCVSKIPDTSLY